jgi:hypothetical protein
VRTKFASSVLLLFVMTQSSAWATALAPFIDLQERGLTLVSTGVGLNARLFPANLAVTIGGPVRFALLYWGGRERPCTFTSGTDCTPSTPPPFKDQEMIFNGTAITGTIIGTETQPVSSGGPILNIGYFADVTSIVSAAGTGPKIFTLADGNAASNLWDLSGASLIVAYTDPANPNFYRVQIHDGLDFAFGVDPTPGDNRVTAPVTFNHGVNSGPRLADLLLVTGNAFSTRPDEVTISNNPTLFGTLNGSSGANWDNDGNSVNIPAGVGTTTVQVVSPAAQADPDSLFWMVAALRVQQLDTQPPQCPITLNDPGPPARIEVTIRDTGSGLAEILVTRSENADTVVPPFTVGTTDPVVTSSTKIDQTKRARIEIQVSDLAGNVRICDPYLFTLLKESRGPVYEIVDDVPQAEGFVTLTNGSPGMRAVLLQVNDQRWTIALRDGQEKTVDVRSAMRPGAGNVIIIAAEGPRWGAKLDVLIWEGN